MANKKNNDKEIHLQDAELLYKTTERTDLQILYFLTHPSLLLQKSIYITPVILKFANLNVNVD